MVSSEGLRLLGYLYDGNGKCQMSVAARTHAEREGGGIRCLCFRRLFFPLFSRTDAIADPGLREDVAGVIGVVA